MAPHLVQLIERVKASHEVKAPIFSSTRSLSRRNAVELCRSFMGLYEYLVDFMVLVYALCLGALEVIAIRLEAIAIRLEVIAIRLEVIASR